MIARLRSFLDVRPGETVPLLVTFVYMAIAVGSFLLAKPIRPFIDKVISLAEVARGASAGRPPEIWIFMGGVRWLLDGSKKGFRRIARSP